MLVQRDLREVLLCDIGERVLKLVEMFNFYKTISVDTLRFVHPKHNNLVFSERLWSLTVLCWESWCSHQESLEYTSNVTNVELVVEFEGSFLEETANLSMELKSSSDDWLGLLLDVLLEFFEVAI